MSDTILYGRNTGASQFYWWCQACEKYGLEDRLSFALTAGRQHKAIDHG